MLQRIFLVRHGETDWNREGRAQGQHDVPLNETGREQARIIGAFLKTSRPSMLMSSDLCRALETAEIIGMHLGLSPAIHQELRERNMGSFSGMNHHEIRACGVTDLTRWDGLPGVETDATLLERVLPCLNRFIESGDGEGVVVTHGGIIKVLIDKFMGLSAEQPRRFILHNGLVAIFRPQNGQLMLDGLLYPELISGPCDANLIDNSGGFR